MRSVSFSGWHAARKKICATDTFTIKMPYDLLFARAERVHTTFSCLRFS